jgi:hypothetical protein
MFVLLHDILSKTGLTANERKGVIKQTVTLRDILRADIQ